MLNSKHCKNFQMIFSTLKEIIKKKTECFNMKFYYYKNKKLKGMFIILISEHLIYSTRDLNFTMLTCFMKNSNHLTTNMQ